MILQATRTRWKQVSAVVGTALLPSQMRGSRERLGQALLWPRFGIEYLGSPRFTFVHDAGVFELFDARLFSSVKQKSIRTEWSKDLGTVRRNELIICVAHLKDLFAGKHIPGKDRI